MIEAKLRSFVDQPSAGLLKIKKNLQEIKARAIFLDRDGVINKYPGDTKYVTSLKEFRFLPGAKKAIALLAKSGFKIFVISNQGGVNKGLFSADALAEITRKMLSDIEEAGGKVDGVYYCIHRQDENCSCRKPKAGLIHTAMTASPLDMKDSFFVGDTIRDIATAKSAGCKSILVFSGKEKAANSDKWEVRPDFTFDNLYKAAKFIHTFKEGQLK